MLGHGCLKAKTPSTSLPTISSPETGSIMAGSIPKKGREALPGLVGVIPPRGVMTCEPVSVCQYVYSFEVRDVLKLESKAKKKQLTSQM